MANERSESAQDNFGWLVGFYGISTFVGYSTPTPFYANN